MTCNEFTQHFLQNIPRKQDKYRTGHGTCIRFRCCFADFQRQKERMVYRDLDFQDDDDDIAPRTFSVEEKLASTDFDAQFVSEKKGSGEL